LNNSAKNEPNLIIFGVQNPEKISHLKIVYGYLITCVVFETQCIYKVSKKKHSAILVTTRSDVDRCAQNVLTVLNGKKMVRDLTEQY